MPEHLVIRDNDPLLLWQIEIDEFEETVRDIRGSSRDTTLLEEPPRNKVVFDPGGHFAGHSADGGARTHGHVAIEKYGRGYLARDGWNRGCRARHEREHHGQ